MISESPPKALNTIAYRFAEFTLEAENLLLLRNSEAVPLAPKAVEVLLTLIEANGKLITKQEILDKVWKDTFVEEANLTHHISALRKALGEDKNSRKFIETIPRRGYRFVADVKNAAVSEIVEITISERTTELLREEIQIETSIAPSVEQIIRVSDFRKNESPRSSFVKIAVTAGCILLAVFGGLAVYQFIKLRRESKTPNGNLAPISYMRLIDNKSIGGTVISPDGKFAAYFQNYFNGEGGTIFLRQLDTNREVSLLEPADRIFGNKEIGKMCYSPDGKFLYFVARVDSFFQKIYRLDLATRRTERITNDGNTYSNYGMAISADGKILVADLTEIKGDLWSIAANGSETDARRVKSGDTNGRRGLAVLADSSFVYTARIGDKYDIWISSPDGQNTQPLTNDAFEERTLTASHDGRFIVFSSDRDGNRHLFRMNADGSDLKQLTFGETNDWQPDFSPDDNWIVYVAVEADKMLVKKIDIEGGTPVSLTDYPAVNPTFSPDGSRIALKIPSDSRTLPGTLAVIPATGGKPEKTFSVTDFEWFPSTIPIRWTADGAALIFRRERGGAGNLWQQNLNGSPPLQLTNFTTETIYNFAYSPDRTRILLSRGLYQTSPVMIRNF